MEVDSGEGSREGAKNGAQENGRVSWFSTGKGDSFVWFVWFVVQQTGKGSVHETHETTRKPGERGMVRVRLLDMRQIPRMGHGWESFRPTVHAKPRRTERKRMGG